MIEAREVLCSENPSGDRLMTMWCRYPKFIHGEHLKHRSFSFSVSSSRAIPVAKNLEEVRSDELRAAPVWWGREQKGMKSGEELDNTSEYIEWPFKDEIDGRWFNEDITERLAAKRTWKITALLAVGQAEYLTKLGAHKSIVNRLLEPFLHVNVLVTGTTAGWMNFFDFFGLRLDKGAQPEMRALAEAQWRIWQESKPQRLQPGEWHLPFLERQQLWQQYPDDDYAPHAGQDDLVQGLTRLQVAQRISIARCARLSYQSFKTGRRSTIEEDLRLYEKLVGSSPIHASPAEHQAMPAKRLPEDFWPTSALAAFAQVKVRAPEFEHEWEAGNLGPGWRQYRKMLPDEAIAPLPIEYQYV